MLPGVSSSQCKFCNLPWRRYSSSIADQALSAQLLVHVSVLALLQVHGMKSFCLLRTFALNVLAICLGLRCYIGVFSLLCRPHRLTSVRAWCEILLHGCQVKLGAQVFLRTREVSCIRFYRPLTIKLHAISFVFSH